MKILFLLLLLYSISLAQVYMNIKNKDGTTAKYNIEEIRKLSFSGVVGIKEEKKITNAIKSFSLLQNYPNPFNPSTTIEYQIPSAGNVEVNIYNIAGQLVKNISNGFQNGGSYKVNWNSKNNFGQNVSSGIYLFQVKYENTFLTKKLMLIK